MSQEEAMQTIVDALKQHEIDFGTKLAELHKLFIGLSGVMLSVLGSFQSLLHSASPQFSWLLQVSLLAFLLSVLFGVFSTVLLRFMSLPQYLQTIASFLNSLSAANI